MWPLSVSFLALTVLLSLAVLSLGTPVPQQAPGFPVHAALLEPGDDPARLRRYQTYGLTQAMVERVQPVSNVHPDAAPFMNVPNVREANANSIERSALEAYEGAIQQQQANMVYTQAPATAPMAAPAVEPMAVPAAASAAALMAAPAVAPMAAPAVAPMAAPAVAPMAAPAVAPMAAPAVAPAALSGAVPGLTPGAPLGAPLGAVPEEGYNTQGDGMVASTLSNNMASQTMDTQGSSAIRDMSGGDIETSGPAIPTSDLSLHMSSGTGAYASQEGMNVSPGAEQAVLAGASSAIPGGTGSSVGSSQGFASPTQATSLDSTNAPEENAGLPMTGIAGTPTASIAGTTTVRQSIPEQFQGNFGMSNIYTSRMVEPTAAQSRQFNGREGPHSQYGEMVDDTGMQAHSPGLGVSSVSNSW